MIRRAARLVALYLLLGVVATWAVAWGSASLVSPGELVRQFHERRGPPFRSATEWRCWGGRLYALEDLLDPQQLEEARRGALPGMQFDTDWPRLAAPLVGHDADGAPSPVAFVEARGWPWLAVWCKLEFAPEVWSRLSDNSQRDYWADCARRRGVMVSVFDPEPVPRGGVQGRPTRGRFYSPTFHIVFPYLPYWPGLIGNTVFYAVLLAGLHQLAAWGWRARRHRPGHCPHCGYDRSGLPTPTCPECGSQSTTK